MIKTEIKGNIVRIYSDEGKFIRRKGTRFKVSNAYERIGTEHEWEEVEDDE